MSQYKKDMIASFFFLILGALVLISVPLTIQDPGVSVMGPRVFPYFIGACMVILSLALMAHHHCEAPQGGRRRQHGNLCLRGGEKAGPAGRAAGASAGRCDSGLCGTVSDSGVFYLHASGSHRYSAYFRVKKIWAYPVVYAAAVAIWAGFTFLLSVRLP